MEEDAWEGPLQEFRHEELRSNTCIRLIRIHAQLFRGDISCTLRIFESDTPNCLDYVALSYVWGDSTPTHTIYVNGLVYRVHQSLWELLSHRRTKDTEHVWIWTDLLCIDQAHHSEKNEQISRMGDIYSQAAYVISWLGNREETAEAFRTIVEMSEKIDTRCASKYARDSFESKQIVRALRQLGVREPYWERVWIVQEVACAKDCIVVFGDISVSLEDLLRKMKLAMNRSDFFHEYGPHPFTIRRIEALADLKSIIQQGRPMMFLTLIDRTLFCEATRDQDRVYGLLGLACRLDPEFDPSSLEVSQHKSLFDVWWDIIFMVLDGESNMMIKFLLIPLKAICHGLPPPVNHWKLEMGSNIRRSCAETASRVSETVYSEPIQAFLGVYTREYYATLTSRRELHCVWAMVTKHVIKHEHDVPGLQTRLGWSTYAGVEFTSPSCINDGSTQKSEEFLPPGWLCAAAHWPDPLERTTAKNHIEGWSWKAPPEDRYIPAYCSGAKHDGPRCDLSLVVMRIELLGITCIVTSTNTVQIDFYCDCCDPNA